ncbi:MAG: aldo/keto reductase [Alphaproteobacteria bacterium]|jgi:L-galactose dehydrogenase/L-glyceraldehyde 3-phosphate reductase|nr:aldo/keto reductase [Alphaproteobacteria bacterium]
MRKHRLGRTGLEVSEIVFGGGWVGGILIDKDDDTRRAAVKRAFEAGVNWIDTAPAYGNGKSEEALGWLLPEQDVEPQLSTKVALDLDGLDDCLGQVERSLAGSLSRLRRKRVDLLFLHTQIGSETSGDKIGVADLLANGGVADALDAMRDRGLVGAIGLTALGETSAVCEALASGRFDAAQVYYNLLNPSAGRAMPPAWTGQDLGGIIGTCKDNDVGVMNIRTLAAGVIATDTRTGREVPLTPGFELAEEERKAHETFDVLGLEFGTRPQTAIRFSLSHPDIDCVAVGLAEYRHLEEAITAAEMGPLPKAALDKLEGLYANDFGRV